MTRGARAFAFCLLAAGCTTGGVPEVRGGIEMGVRRGAAWSTLTVKPPHVLGPRVTLKLSKGAFSGSIDGRPLHLKVEPDGISGSGPLGQVSVDIEEGPGQLEIQGTWNGARVHFTVTESSLRGTIAVFRPSSGSVTDVLYCQYVLDKVERDGSRSGTSICNGLPEDTLVEIPRTVQGWLTRQELVVILLALLSSPPTTSMERSL